jgi:hypothetical protein
MIFDSNIETAVFQTEKVAVFYLWKIDFRWLVGFDTISGAILFIVGALQAEIYSA